MGLLDYGLDPEAAQRAGMYEGLLRMGNALAQAGAPAAPGQVRPGLGAGLAAGFGAFGQGAREGRQAYLQQGLQDRELARQGAIDEALNAQPGAALSPQGQQAATLLGGLPANARAGMALLGTQGRDKVLGSLLTRRGATTLTPEQARAYGLPEGTVAQVGDDGKINVVHAPPELLDPRVQAARVQIAQASRPQISVDARAMGTGLNQAYELAAKDWQAQRNGVMEASRRDSMLNQFETAMQGFRPGVAAELRLRGNQALAELGLPNNAPAGEVMLAAQRQIELANTPRGQGQITDSERKLVREMLPLMGSTPDGVRTLIEATRALNQRDREVFAIYNESARRNGGAPNPLEISERIAALPPAIPASIQRQMEQAQRQAQSRQPAQAAPHQQAAPPVREGATATGPNGQRIILRNGQWVPMQ